jgi:hypothetical protein
MRSILIEMRRLLENDDAPRVTGREIKKGMQVKINGTAVKVAKVVKNKIGRAVDYSVTFADAGEGLPKKSMVLGLGDTLELVA